MHTPSFQSSVLHYATLDKKNTESEMVQNPIREGPLYETLETQFNNVNTITAATKTLH